jgi:predicted metal-dependent phosphoesterase TrpH
MIDLHLHTTASDGCCSPEDLVERAAAAGLTVMSVTDHDTMAAVPAVAAAASRLGITCIPGIELTSVWEERDVHVLGYFVCPDALGLKELIADMRRARVGRARLMLALLARAGARIDLTARLEAAEDGGPTIARPEIARALVAAGHVSTVAEAFEHFLGEGRPAFVPHRGPSPTDAVVRIREAGGVASLAHPGPANRDELIPPLVDAGLGALEAYHSNHDDATAERYVRMARELGLAVTGGSDFHGDGMHRGRRLGGVQLPAEAFAGFVERAAARPADMVRRVAVVSAFERSLPTQIL